jgi:drug/metabolite transporter (DMT)-like permease
MLIADLLLVSIGVVWGFNFVVIKDVIGRIDPMLYIMLRYLVAAAIFAVIVPRSLTRSSRQDWLMGGVLGAFYLTALVVQTIGLQYTTPGKSSFITGLNVAMVPFLFWIVARRSPGITQVAGAIIATIGLGRPQPAGRLHPELGRHPDAARRAVLRAPHHDDRLLRPQGRAAQAGRHADRDGRRAHRSGHPVHGRGHALELPWQAWLAIFWTALSGTIYAFFMQSWAQRYTTSTRAAVFLCLESVSGAVFGVMFGMDDLTWRLVGGAGLIFTGIIIIETLPSRAGRPAPVAPAKAILPVEGGSGAGSDAGPGRADAEGAALDARGAGDEADTGAGAVD